MMPRNEFRNKITDYIKDKPELNKLISQEFTDSDIDFAIDMVIDDFNNSPPLLSPVSYDNFPSLVLLVKGTILFMLQGQQLWYSRNRLLYSDGDITVDPYNKFPEYAQMINMLIQEYTQMKNQIKKTMNLNEFYGEVRTTYLL